MRFPFAVVLLAALGFNTAQAEIYKCTVNGRTAFTQLPCGADAVEVNLQVFQPTEADIAQQKRANRSVANATLNMTYSSELNRMRRAIVAVDAAIEQLTEERDERLEWLRYQRSLANNNLAGAVWENSLVIEMNGVTSTYENRIQRLWEARVEAVRQLEEFERQGQALLDESMSQATP